MPHALMMHIVKPSMGLRTLDIRIHVFTQPVKHALDSTIIKAAFYKETRVYSFPRRPKGDWKRFSKMRGRRGSKLGK